MDIHIRITRQLMVPPIVTVEIEGIEKDEVEEVVEHVGSLIKMTLETARPAVER